MRDKLLLGTRKGLLILNKNRADWSIESAHFEGVPVPYAMHDPRNDTLWVSLDHGHWGGKLHRSRDPGRDLGRGRGAEISRRRYDSARFQRTGGDKLYLAGRARRRGRGEPPLCRHGTRRAFCQR